MEIHTPSLCYLLEVFFPYLHRVFPAVAQIDGMGSSHCPFADEVTVIDIAVLVDTVHHQMQVGNPRLGIIVEGSEVL